MAISKEDYLSAVDLKVKGNEAFKAGDYKTALKYYCLGIGWVGMNSNASLRHFETKTGGANPYSRGKCSDIEIRTNDLRLILFNNMAQTYLKTGDYALVVQKTSRVLHMDPMNAKALFRRAMAYRKRGQLTNARMDLELLADMPDHTGYILRSSEVIQREFRLLDEDDAAGIVVN